MELLIAYAIIAAGILSIFYVMWGGIQFIMSHGEETKKKKAIHTIQYALIGLLVTVFAVVIVQFVGKIIGLDVVQYISFDEITRLINSINGRRNGINTLD